DPHTPRGFDDTTRDLAAIGDQNALEHAVQYPEMPAYRALRGRRAIVNATLAARNAPRAGHKEGALRDFAAKRAPMTLHRAGRAPVWFGGHYDRAGPHAPCPSRTGRQCAFDRLALGTWETIHSRISVSMSTSLLARTQGVTGWVVARANWGMNVLMRERSMVLTRVLKRPSEPAAPSQETAATPYPLSSLTLPPPR